VSQSRDAEHRPRRAPIVSDMLKAAVGHSDDIDDDDAAHDVMTACETQLAGARPIAALVFAGSTKDPTILLEAIATRYPNLPVCGTTARAELSSSIAHAEDSFAVLMLASDTVAAAAGFGTDAVSDPRGAARRAVAMARESAGAEPRLCIAFSNGTRVDMSHVLDGLSGALGDVPVVGGASSCAFTGNNDIRQLCGTSVLRDTVVVLLLCGDLRFSYAVGRGWTPVGASHVVTKAHDNLLVELDGRPALEIYQRYLGASDQAGASFVHHPLAVFESSGEDFYLRAGRGQGDVPGSIVTAGHVPPGARVRLTEYQRDRIVDAAASAAAAATQRWSGGEPAAAIVFTCSARKTVLGTWTPREIDALRATLSPSTPIVGYYAFSELAPFGTGGNASRVHNNSFVTLLLG